MRASTKKAALVLCANCFLSACNQPPPQPTSEQISMAEAALPASASLAKIYQRSCVGCHTSPVSTAPLVGFQEAWQPRLKQGRPALLLHARDGYKAMPAKGMCSDCSDSELEQLIEFMINPTTQHR